MDELNGKLAVALVSGGIDSPVAVARMVKSGWSVICLHCSQEPITGPEAEAKTISSLSHLRDSQGPLGEVGKRIDSQVRIVPVADALSLFTATQSHRDYFVHMKRLFNAIATLLAEEVGATHILTGENLGQVSSQTLGNLGAVECVTELPILRPLLGLDKQEIVDHSRSMGTFSISKGPEVCDALGPKKPTTVANIRRLLENEAEFGGIDEISANCWKNVTIRSLSE